MIYTYLLTVALVIGQEELPEVPQPRHIADIIAPHLKKLQEYRRKESQRMLEDFSEALEQEVAPCTVWSAPVPKDLPLWRHPISAKTWINRSGFETAVLEWQGDSWIWCSYAKSPALIFELGDGKQFFIIAIRDDVELATVVEALKQGRGFSRVAVGPRPDKVLIPFGSLNRGFAPYFSEKGLSWEERQFPADTPEVEGNGLLFNRFVWLWGDSPRSLKGLGYYQQ